MKTINLHGNEYATYEAVLNEAHKKGLVSIKTELISLPSSENNYLCVFKAIVTMKDEKVFEGIGDATPKNVSSNIVPHIIRMAETRAKGRALRDAVNIGKALAEEFGDDLKTSKSKKVNKSECKHKNQVSRKSNSEKNKDRIYISCTDCKSFLKWA